MPKILFPTAQDAENAFYEALERADYDAMCAVWAEDEEIVCVHPGGARLQGAPAVLEHWRNMFKGEQRLRLRIANRIVHTGMMITVHCVHEMISIEGEPRNVHPVIATNVYLRTPAGWRMLAHHASPAPGPVEPAETAAPGEPPKLLH